MEYGHMLMNGSCFQLATASEQVAQTVSAALDKKGMNLDHGKCPAEYDIEIQDTKRDGYSVTMLNRHHAADGANQPFTFDATPDPTLDLEAIKSDDSTYHYTSQNPNTCFVVSGFTSASLVESWGNMEKEKGNGFSKGPCPAWSFDQNCHYNGKYTTKGGETFTSHYCEIKKGTYHFIQGRTCFQLPSLNAGRASRMKHYPKWGAGACPVKYNWFTYKYPSRYYEMFSFRVASKSDLENAKRYRYYADRQAKWSRN